MIILHYQHHLVNLLSKMLQFNSLFNHLSLVKKSPMHLSFPHDSFLKSNIACNLTSIIFSWIAFSRKPIRDSWKLLRKHLQILGHPVIAASTSRRNLRRIPWDLLDLSKSYRTFAFLASNLLLIRLLAGHAWRCDREIRSGY